MKCRVCERETREICLCGYCSRCIEEYGHDKCEELVKKWKEKK